MKRELTGAKDELADVCSHVEAGANPHRSKKRQNKPAHNNYFEGLAMLVMNFHLQSTLYKKLKSSIFVFLKTNSRNSVILLQSLLKNALTIF